MLNWPNQIENGASIEFDICIAGAGATGITLALEFENSELHGTDDGGVCDAPEQPQKTASASTAPTS